MMSDPFGITVTENVYDKALELERIAPMLNDFDYDDIVNLENAYVQIDELIEEIKLNPFKVVELEGIYDFHNKLTSKLFKNLKKIYKKRPRKKKEKVTTSCWDKYAQEQWTLEILREYSELQWQEGDIELTVDGKNYLVCRDGEWREEQRDENEHI